jgi:AraC-like DNA-binding protein
MNMIPSLKKLGAGSDNIFEVLMENKPHFYPYWHYHPQYELMLIEKSSGTRYVGDNISPFQDGEITFLGANIPHLFRNHPEYFEKRSRKRAKATVLYFSDEFTGSDFFNLSEMAAIKELLQLSQRGLSIQGNSKAEVARRLIKVVKETGFNRLMEFISLLQFIATRAEYKALSSLGFSNVIDEKDLSRLNKIFDYLLKNFGNNITLSEVSQIANMSSTAFCRYFKERTNKTMITFLNEIRIGHACKLLIENRNMTISQICYECGFNNLTNFNIQFKKLKKMSPLDFRQKYSLPLLIS